MQTASAPIVPFKAALRVTLCQAVGPVGRGGLSGILIGLALSVISGGALYCKTGLCTIDTITDRKKKLERVQRFTPHTQTVYPAIHSTTDLLQTSLLSLRASPPDVLFR